MLTNSRPLAGKQSTPNMGGKRGAPAGVLRPVAAGKVCPTCQFATHPPHDSRKHRVQGGKENWKPFDQEWLNKLGLSKLAQQDGPSTPSTPMVGDAELSDRTHTVMPDPAPLAGAAEANDDSAGGHRYPSNKGRKGGK